MNLDKYISIAEKQESVLRFPHFSRKDAWELGQIMVSRILSENLTASVSIRLSSGFVLFQYAPEGTTPENDDWMTRKFNIVRYMEISSLLNMMRLQQSKRSLEGKGLDPRHYAASGGGFPIHVAGTGVIGAATASGLPHLLDHDLLVDSISRFLKISDVPRIPLNAKI